MPSLTDNLHNWSARWDWAQRGDEWSKWWGGTPALWHGVLLPRLHTFLPTGTILEIAPGYGRWTQFLKDVCEQLVIVDLTPECIEHCRERFSASTNIEYHVNDGRSLAMVADRSVDLSFSFDSLVHADEEVIGAYLEELARKLKQDGLGFIHHSNAGAYQRQSRVARRIPPPIFGPLMRRGAIPNLAAWRDPSMTAEIFVLRCEQAGLACIGQEKLSWEYGRQLIDCISLITPRGSRWDRPHRVERNPSFTTEARRMARLYAGASFG